MITPIYHSLSEKLEEYIHDRGLIGRLPGLGPLSREFGVNQLTMSKAIRLLEEKGLVTINGTRGTFVNEERRSRPVYKVIGLVGVTKLDERDYILDHLEPYAERSGYHLLGITGSMELFTTRTQLLTTFPVDGLIFCYSSLTSGIADYLRSERIPIIACNRRPDIPWLDTVDFDHDAHYRKIFAFLKKLGHRRIAVLALPVSDEYRHHKEWINSICRKYLGEDYDDELYYHLPNLGPCPSKREDVRPHVRRILEHACSLAEPPTAFLAPSEYIVELKPQLLERRICVPEDVSLISWGSRLPQEFTQIYFDYRKIWLHGLRRMLQLLNRQAEQPEKKLLKMPCIRGESTAPAPSKKRLCRQNQYFNNKGGI